MINDESVIGGLVAELEKAIEPPEEGKPAPPVTLPGTTEQLASLLADLRPLGPLGLLVAISDAPPPSDEVHLEVPTRIADKIRSQLAEDRAKIEASGATPPPAPAEGAALPELVTLFLERKGEKARLVLRKLVENVFYDFYELKEHGLFIDDVGRALEVIKGATGSTDNAQTFMKRLAALSQDTAKFMLGLFPEQIALIYKVAQNQAERSEIDAAFDMFAPRVIWKRVWAIMKALLQKEKRFRLTLQIWSRLHGVAITRDHMMKLEPILAVKDVKDLVQRAIDKEKERKALVEFIRARAAVIDAIEGAY